MKTHLPLVPILCGLGLLFANDVDAQQTVCVRVKLEIPQRLTFERDAFEATLRLTNRLDDAPLEDLDVDIVVRAISPGAPDVALFIAPPTTTGIAPSNVDGAGAIAAAGTGSVQYLLIPTVGAGGTLPSGLQYGVKALIRYRAGAVQFDAETFEEIITVKPQPELALHYYLPRRVQANTPFEVGVHVENTGFGDARNLQIESAQPRIVENLSGLLIGFSLVGTFRNADILPNTLTIPFGTLPPDRCGMGAWAMTTTRDGEFVELDVTMKHKEELGGDLTSLINTTASDFLIQRVVDDRAGKDVVFDAALDLATSDDGVPDLILESDCSTETLTPHNGTSSGTPGPDDPIAGLSTSVAIGWNYARAPDPAGGLLPILKVTRDRDGKVLHPRNAWLDVDDALDPIVSLVDFSVAGNVVETYTITYDLTEFDDTPPVTRLAPRDPFAFFGASSVAVTPTTVMVLAATDDASGVATTSLQIDANAPEQNRPFFFSNGTHTVRFSSVDRKNNAEAPQTITVVVDRTAPTLDFTAPDVDLPHSENLPIAFAFSGVDDTDPDPDVEAVLVRLNPTVELFPVTDGQVLAPNVLTAGEYALRVALTDHVDNRDDVVVGPFIVTPRVALPPRLVVTGVADGDFVNAAVVVDAVIEADDALVTQTLLLDGAPFPGPATVVAGEGAHAIVMDALDAAGRAANDRVEFVVDTIAPQVSVQGVVANSISETAVAPTVVISDDNLDVSTVTLDGAAFVDGDVVGDVAAEDGAHVLVARATDKAGNVTTVTVPFTVDIRAPRIAFSGFVDGALHPAPVRPAFTVEDTTPTSVIALLDGKDFVPGVLVGDGDHVLEVRATDALARLTTARATFAVDTTAPRVRVIGVSDGGIYPAGVAAVVEVEEPRLFVLDVVLDGAAYVDGTPISAEGNHLLQVRAVDDAGHVADVDVAFAIDPEAPVITVDGVEDGATYRAAVHPIVTTDDPTDTLVMTLDGLPYIDAVVDGEGKHTLIVTATDTDGHRARLELRFTIDGTPPAVVVTGVVDGGVYNGAVRPDVVLESEDIDSVDALLDGDVFVLGTPVSAVGAHRLELVIRDTAENETRLVVRFTIDPNAAALSIGGVADGAYVNDDVVLDVVVPSGAIARVFVDGVVSADGAVVSAEGRHVVRAEAVVGGVVSAVAGLTFTIDKTAPVVSVAGVDDGAVLRGPVEPVFVATDAFLAIAVAAVDDVPFDAGSIDVEGAHRLVVTATDRAGNETVVDIDFVVDNTAPVVTFTAPLDGQQIVGSFVPAVAVVEPNSATLVIDVDGIALAAGVAFAVAGDHVVTAKAVDRAGNVGTAVVNVSVVAAGGDVRLTIRRNGAPAVGDGVVLYRFDDDGSVSRGADGVVDDDGRVEFVDVPDGRYRARVEHVWQRFFTAAFVPGGGRVFFDIPDEPAPSNVVYVDGAADDDGEGSEAEPFRSLDRALAASSFDTLIKVAGGAYDGTLRLPRGVTVRGGYDGGSWAFAPAQNVVTVGDVALDADAVLADVSAGDVSGAGLVHDVIAANVDVSGADGFAANVLADSVVAGAGARAEFVTADHAEGDVAFSLSDAELDDVDFVKGPLHDRYLAQTRGGQDADSAGVDGGELDAAVFELRGRTTAINGALDRSVVDKGFHAWPVTPPPPEPEKPKPPAPKGCATSSPSTFAVLLVLLPLLRRRRSRR